MKIYYDPLMEQFVGVKADQAISENEEIFPIELVVDLIPVAMTFLEWLWVKIQGSPKEREAARKWKAAKKDKKRAFKLEKMRIKLESKKP